MLPFALLFGLVQTSGTAPSTDPAPLAKLIGIGVQIYTCGPNDKWIFQAPEANLFQDRTQVGTHGAGPRWTWTTDGSALTGKLVTSTPAADPVHNIPSLELTATAVPGTSGTLTPVTRITRTETQGGVAPAEGCTAPVRGETLRVPYAATYTFYPR